ncbi:uncharacterized protein A4U43_C03F370 [Asparagus officinalis]|uniref:Pentacotripeptide-repeat region of PRORP domain-containing protein n=1 Tax=Asparagus officinalis TaxID=4686 RepID=A0A5P1F652_ASPOF|nr:pentatricopeptide repeat-containing protein At1g74600, chloroplastic [Asparagus officinalis]ONK73865.1 uncharacterized protein A4U43_C03F370 [Asparagus officinalis]
MRALHHCLQRSSTDPIPSIKLLSSLSEALTTNPDLNPRPNPRPPPPPQSSNSPPIRQITNLNNAHFSKSFKHHFPRSAHHQFDKIPQPNLNSEYVDPLSALTGKQASGLDPDQFDYGNALSTCAASQNLNFGEQIFSLVMKNGFFSDGYVVTGLIDLFSKSGRFDDALRVFGENYGGNVVCWNAIIAGGVRNGENLIALDLFRRMVCEFCMPNGFTFSSLLSACAVSGLFEMGRAIHGWVLKCNVKNDIFVGTGVVDLYAKCGHMDDAVREFSRMPARNVVSWTAMISGFVHNEDAYSSVKIFKEMIQNGVEVNKYTLTSVLLAFSKSFMVKETMQIHCWTWKNGLFFMDFVVKEAFINTYARLGELKMSLKIFEEMGLTKSLSTWSAMISGLVQNQMLRRSVELLKRIFHEDLKPDKKCISSVLSIVGDIELGRNIHSYSIKAGLLRDVLVASALFTMYSKCGSIEDSYELFTQMDERDSISWTSMVSGFAVHGHAEKAFQLFREMVLEGVHPDQTTLSAVLMACYDSQFLMKGKQIHAYALRHELGNETIVASALVSMYSRCKILESSRRVFDGISCKDQAMCSSLVSGYSTNGYSEAALSEFHCMVVSGFGLDHVTCSSVLQVCANLSKLDLGKQLHAYGIKGGLMSQCAVSSALVTMYSKCGSIDDSYEVFDEIEQPDLVAWTALIDGYAEHGRGLEALGIFQQMKLNRVKPDSVTYLSILSACNHNGLVNEGVAHFNSMRKDYGIEPEQHHYASVVDLLGRSGRLKEAANFIDRMPVEPDWLVWSALLGSCTVHGDVELARLAARKIHELAPHESVPYISASKISSQVGDWEEAVRIRNAMKGDGINKEPGLSFF